MNLFRAKLINCTSDFCRKYNIKQAVFNREGEGNVCPACGLDMNKRVKYCPFCYANVKLTHYMDVRRYLKYISFSLFWFMVFVVVGHHYLTA